MADLSPSALPREICEEDAVGAVADIYADIKAALGLPMVNMIYRRLAVELDALVWCWENAKPLAAAGVIDDAGDRLAEVFAIESIPELASDALQRAGVVEDQRPVLLAAIDGYNRANPRNLVLLGVLKALRFRTPATADTPAGLPRYDAPAQVALPPMVLLDAMPPEIAESVQALMRHRAADDTFSVPSMYRHLANWPGALALAVEIVGPMMADGRIPLAAAALTKAAMRTGAEIAPAGPSSAAPAPESDAGRLLDRVIESFSDNIPDLIGVGHVLRQVFSPAVR